MNWNEFFASKKAPGIEVTAERVIEAAQTNLPAVIKHIALEETIGADAEQRQSAPMAFSGGYDNGIFTNTGYVPIFTTVFNGEKNKGELGSPKNLLMDYRAIRARAYQSFGTSDIVKMIAGKVFKWEIGSGLKMQSIPDIDILGFEGVDEDFKAFVKNTEAYFALWAESPRSDYNGNGNAHINALKNKETKFLGGDALTVCRVDENYNLSTQIIDGQHVQTPFSDNIMIRDAKARGNIIIHGIEMDVQGRHIAFYVQKQVDNIPIVGSWERIEAIGKESGCLMAWMGYNGKHRIDHHRGISALTAVIEKITKIDRFTEAAVSNAEEVAKIYLQIVHGKTSDGENPLVAPLKRRVGMNDPMLPFDQAELVSKNIQATENKMAYNMPVDSELKAVNNQGQVNYEPFFRPVLEQLCASMDAPPEVVTQKYSSNYSASRAAINMWGYIVDIGRKTEARDYYQKVYNLWLYLHILNNKVSAKKYLEAKAAGNMDVVEAYSRAKFTGVNMPHIDPKKEADAIRIMLGINDQTPLITHEDAVEQLGNGEFDANLEKIKDEMAQIKAAGLPDIVPLPPVTPSNKDVKD